MNPKHYDLIVVGGGMTGAAAAVSAARRGLHTLLVEQSGALGGAACTCLVNPFMKYWTGIPGTDERLMLSRGFFQEMLDRLSAYGTAARDGSCFSEEYVKRVLDDLTAEAGVEVLFHATLCGADKDGDAIRSIRVATKAGVLPLTADLYIDCTGDGDLAAQSGCPFRLGRPADGLCQPMTLCFRLGNVDTDAFWADKPHVQDVYRAAQQSGETCNPREDVLVFRTLNRGVLHFNTTRIVKLNPTDPFDVSRAERLGRRQMWELFDLLRREIPACKDAELLMSAAQIGVRESRMIDGRYVLTAEDLKACTRFPDAIAAGNYDIDIHNPSGAGTSHYLFPDGQYYTIPYRSLLPLHADNLLVAGRCISATHEAQASIRIMPIVTCLGEAAGVAAAAAHRAGVAPADADVTQIQADLRAAGAFVGE